MDNLENDLKVFQNLSVPHIESKLNQIKVYFEKLTFNSQQRDEYIQIIFCKEHGLIAFILRNLSKSNYTKANNDALEVIYTIINSFPLQTWRYGEDLVNLTRTILMFYKLDYRIYCKSFNIIEKLVKMKGAEKFVADLYDQLYAKLNNLHQSAQVKKQYYKTLGLIIRNHYEIINLKQEILQSLQQNICKAYSNASYLEMEGMISCLSDCLICMEVNETNSFVNVIYPIFKEIITMQLKIRTLPRSVFEFFQNHISIFGKNLFDCQWYHIFNTWSSYTDENAKVAFNMALIYFRFLSLYNISDDNDLIYKDTIKFYVENYKDLILEERAIGFERHLAIRAYGFLAKPYAFLVNSAIEDHNKIMNFIKKNHEKDMKYMGSYISTVSELISIEFAEEKFEFMIILISKLVRNFPTVNNTYCINDIAEALHNIWKVDPKRYDYMLKNIIFEGIQWTCSHDVVDEQTKYVDESVITYLNYLPFWEGLLKNLSNSVDENTSETFYKDFCRELIYTKLKLIYKLNLDIVYEEADTFTQSNIKAKQQYDFNIFVNMIDLYSNLLPLVNQAQIKPYIISSIKHFVKLSVKYPLVIGFYKILIIWLRIASRANYFSAKRVEQRHDLQKVCALLSSFAYDVLLQLKEFGENLQTTCLELIVLLPTRVLKDHLPMVTLQMIVILKCERVGDTIDAVIDALENLCSEFAMSEISPYIRQVLPHLDAYLRNSSTDWTNSTIKWNRKSMTSLQKRRVRIESDTVMYRLQKRIVKFIGKLSSELCIAFAEDTSTIKPISRNKSNHLQLNLAYGNKDVVFPLDELLPSIIQLTRVCNDRKTKFAACELLHCITTLILQKNVSECEDGRRLLENVIFTVLLLGCDVDEELSKIFYHFFMQIIHWYTKPNASKNDVEVLLDALMIGVTSETNSSLRTFSGLCLQEFLLWTKKQKTSKSRLIDDPYFVFIVDKIEQFNMHSDAHKRLGSAIIFNSIYRILREDDDLINTYWIKLLYIFISSLSTTDLVGDDKYFQQITFALDHLKRVFVHPSKRALFNTTNQDRILPVPFKGSTLNDVARWLFETYATSSAPSTRDACIRFFDAIVPHVINYRNLETFLNDNNIQFPNQTDLFCSLTDVSFANEQKHDNLVRWLNDFRKITDFYYTAVAQSLALDLNQSFMEAFATFTGILINNESLLINDVQQRKCLKSLQFSTTVNILKLAAAFLETNNNRVLNVHAFFGRTYCKFLLHCIIKMKDIAWSYDLNRLESLLNQIAQLHGYYKSDLFDSEFRNEIDSYKINDELRKDMDSYTCTRRYVQMLKGIVFMQKTALNDFVKIDLQFREIIGNDRNAEPNESVNLKWAITLKNCTDVCELIDCLMDANETSDQVESLNNFRKYQAGILNFLLGHFDTGVSYLLEKYHDITRDIVVYLNDLMIYLSENVEQIQGITTEDLLCALLQCWPKLTPYFHKNTTSLNQGVTLLRNVISLIGNKGDALNNISSWIMSRFPADNDINLEQYLKISSVLLTLFPYMTRPQNEEAELRVYQSIKWKILEKDLASDDIRFIHVFLMDINEVLYASPSLNFLKFVFEIFAKCAAANDINLENALKSYLRNIDNDLQVHILEFTYEMCNDRLNYSIEERYKVGKIAFSHLLHHSSLSAIETFFVKMIPRIKSRIATNVLFNNDDEIIEAIINLIVIENLFVHFDYDTHDFINKPFKMACIKRCYGVPRETENLTGVDANYLRLYNCHAYNALASIVCNMKKERQDKHYDMLIPYNTTTLNRLFHKEAYSFDYDASEAVTYKRIFTVVREDLMKNRKSIDASSKTPIYVESMSLFKSSLLVGSFAKYDFSHANIREEGIDNGNSRSDIMLNVDIINNHECMSTCCMIIRQAYESMEIMEVTPSMSLPKWAENVRCILISDIHSNLCKIFLVKMVYNVKDVFEPFAAHFLEPVINVILTCFGDKITSLTTESFG